MSCQRAVLPRRWARVSQIAAEQMLCVGLGLSIGVLLWALLGEAATPVAWLMFACCLSGGYACLRWKEKGR